jgi:hypothetical protein
MNLFDLLPKLEDHQKFVSYLFSLFVGLYAFLIIIAIFLPGGISERDETMIFLLGWPVAFTSTILTVIHLTYLHKKLFQQTIYPLWVLVAFNSLLFTIITTSLNFLWQQGQNNDATIFIVNMTLLIAPLSNGLLIWLVIWRQSKISLNILQKVTLLGCIGLFNFINLVPDPDLHYQTPLTLLFGAILGGAVLSRLKINIPKIHQNHLINFAFDFFAIIMIILACYDPTFNIDPHHENFYLGAANRILNGGTMLVDTFSQYGVLLIYFISIIFQTRLIPFTYQGLILINSILFMFHFIFIYLLLVELFKNRLYSLLVLGIILLLGFFGTLGTIQQFPSTGPLRFGFSYLVLAQVYFRRRFYAIQKWGFLIEFFLIGIASLWSIETFIYTVIPYLGICFYESFYKSSSFGFSVKTFFWRVMWFSLSLIIFQLGFLLFTILRSGKFPDWGSYLGFFTAYSMDGFGSILIYPWSYWFIFIGIYFAASILFFFRFYFRKGLGDSAQGIYIFGLTLIGIITFTYFLGRSHPNAYYHISTPAVIIVGYGYSEFKKSMLVPELYRKISRFLFFSAVILIILVIFPHLISKIIQNHTGYMLLSDSMNSFTEGQNYNFVDTEQKILNSGSQRPQVADALNLLQKYTPFQKSATIFLSSYTTEILMRSGRIHYYPISDIEQDSISENISKMVLNFPIDLTKTEYILASHDYMFYENREFGANKLEIRTLNRLCQDFSFKEVETSPSGVSVFRLQSRNNIPDDYCLSIQALKSAVIK